MDPNVKTEHKHVVVNGPGQRQESFSERTLLEPQNKGVSTTTIALIAVVAVAAFAVIAYLVVNQNDNEAANRNANLAAATQVNASQPPVIIQQPAPAQQAPVIIQQPAPIQQAPIVMAQPAQASQIERTSANDDAAMQDVATRRLTAEPNMATVVLSINDARAVLTGTVSSAALKAKAEQLVKGVRGVKSVDNKIEISG